jgi:excisionase family DNA binding protein
MNTPPPLTVTELAQLAGVHRNTVVRDIDGGNGVLPAAKIDGDWKIDHADAQAYADARRLHQRADAALAGLRAQAQERIANRAR